MIKTETTCTQFSAQYAFTPNHSTVSALFNITQNWFNATDNNRTSQRKGIHALFIDFKKAFDMVDHRILLMKLAERNIQQELSGNGSRVFYRKEHNRSKYKIC